MKILVLITIVALSCMGCHENDDFSNLKNDLYSHESKGYTNSYAEESLSSIATPVITAEATPTETAGTEVVEETDEEETDTISVSYPSLEDTDGLTLTFKCFSVDLNETIAITDNPALIAVIQLEYNVGATPTILTDISPYQFRAFYKGSEYECQTSFSNKSRIITLKVFGISTKSDDYLSDIKENLQIILYQNEMPHHILNMTGTFNRG